MKQRVSSTFIGRAVELAELQSAYAVLDTGVQTVLIAGPAGIGKSRLVAEFTARLESQTVVLVGRCPAFGNDGMPFAPFITIMRSLLRRHDAAHQAERLLGPHPALGRFLPELAARAGAVGREPEPIQLFGEMLTLLEQLAMARPVVLVLEDLHWADDSSQKLLAFLVANLIERNVLLICTYRPGGAGPLRSLVAELQRHAGVRLIAPEPLTRHEVGRQLAALLSTEPAPAVIARVFERSGGNPLFVEALSQSPDPGESLEKTPDGLNELLLVGQDVLPAHVRAVLRLAAVAGSPVDHALLEAAAEVPEAVLHEALRQLVDQQLLSTTDLAYEFRHVLIRQAIYDDLLPIERTRLHARLARVLSAQPDLLSGERHCAELAHHAFAAGDLTRAAQAFWQAAAIAEQTSAQAERLHHLERLLELWDWVPRVVQRLNVDRLTVLEHAVDAGRRAGAIERGIHAADEALALLEENVDPVRAAHVSYQRARLTNQSSGGGRDDLLHALALLPAEPPTLLRGQVLDELAVTLVFTGDVASAQEYARAAVEIAERLGVSSLAARAYAHLGLATTAADPAAAIEHFTRARRAADADTRTLPSVAVWESAALVAAGDYLEAIEIVQQGLRVAHATFRFLDEGPILVVKWTQALTALGRWPEALSIFDDALTEQLPGLATAALLIGNARILLAQGHFTSAQTHLDTAEKLLASAPWARQYELDLRNLQCRLAGQRGDLPYAADLLTATLSAEDLARHPHEAWPLLVVGTQIGPAALGARVKALASSLPIVTAVDDAHQLVVTAATTEDPSAWDDAGQAWRALGQPYELAQTLFEAAQSHLAAGNRTAAQSALNEAVEIAHALRAAPLVNAVEQLAGRTRLNLDRPSAPRYETPNPYRHGLTRRELDVLRLVARGLSNRQIAAELFISGNTAGVHVSRILGKLGVTSRTQAAAIAHRENLLSEDSP